MPVIGLSLLAIALSRFPPWRIVAAGPIANPAKPAPLETA